ncbi:MAG: DUF2231 domain-containing protein [Thermodesulfobacteriota bacterium]
MTGSLIAKIFPGVAEMTNIHPMVVHFPIALLNAFLVMELLGFLLKRENFRSAATWMLYLGTVGAAGAVVAGLWAATTVSHAHEAHAIMLRHRNIALVVFTLAIVLSVWRLLVHERFSLRGQLMHLLMAVIMVTLMAFGADLGGLMVYKYGVAVKAVPVSDVHAHGGRGQE